MPQPLNRIPTGLLSLFQIKSLGRNPDLFTDEVRPGIDLLDFYLANVSQRHMDEPTTGVTIADRGDLVSQIVVPDGELWLLKAVTAEWQITTGEASSWFFFAPTISGIGDPSTNQPLHTQQIWNSFGQSANNTFSNTRVFERPWFAQAGHIISSWFTIAQSSGGTLTATVRTKVTYFPIEV